MAQNLARARPGVTRATPAGRGGWCNSQLQLSACLPPQRPATGTGRHGLTAGEKPDPIGYAVAFLNRLAQTGALDRFGLRRPTERVVFEATRSGFRTLGAVNRQFARAGRDAGLAHPGARRVRRRACFDLTPTEDEQMLVDVVARVRRRGGPPGGRARPTTAAPAPEAVLKASLEIGLPILGVPEELGGISTERSAMAGTLVAEALAHGDMGLAVADARPRRGEHGAVPVGHATSSSRPTSRPSPATTSRPRRSR